jgi:Uma2 family endonuclease
MRALVLDPATAGLEELLERRRVSGLDRLDEVWDGVLHLVPAPGSGHAQLVQQLAEVLGPLARKAGLTPAMGEFNLGDSDHDFRVPDGGLLRHKAPQTWISTAPLVVEILSADDETWDKLPFYAAHRVGELLILDPRARKVHWLRLAGGTYEPVARSTLIELGPAALAEQIEWPG